MKKTNEVIGQQLNDVYKAYPILKSIDEKNKKLVSEHLVFRTLESGQYLKVEECPGFIFVIKGRIKVERIDSEGRQTSLYEIGRGEICHESLSCYIGCENLEIVGYALADTRVGILPKVVMQNYLLEDIGFMQYLYKNLYNKFKLIISHKESIIHESIEDRLIKYMKKNDTGVIYATHQEIALELGTSREVVSRKLKKLEEEGRVELGRGKIKIIKSGK